MHNGSKWMVCDVYNDICIGNITELLTSDGEIQEKEQETPLQVMNIKLIIFHWVQPECSVYSRIITSCVCRTPNTVSLMLQ